MQHPGFPCNKGQFDFLHQYITNVAFEASLNCFIFRSNLQDLEFSSEDNDIKPKIRFQSVHLNSSKLEKINEEMISPRKPMKKK